MGLYVVCNRVTYEAGDDTIQSAYGTCTYVCTPNTKRVSAGFLIYVVPTSKRHTDNKIRVQVRCFIP